MTYLNYVLAILLIGVVCSGLIRLTMRGKPRHSHQASGPSNTKASQPEESVRKGGTGTSKLLARDLADGTKLGLPRAANQPASHKVALTDLSKMRIPRGW